MTFAQPIEASRHGFFWAIAVVSVSLICNGFSDPINSELNRGSMVQKQEPHDSQKNVEAKENKAPSQQASGGSVDEQIAHGKYLVHHVAQCVQCHTPRDQAGALIDSRLMTGATIPIKGPSANQPWAAKSVSLAGLGNYDESFVCHLLTHGQRPDDTHPKNPMPSFHLNQDDAEAVVAYLKSL